MINRFRFDKQLAAVQPLTQASEHGLGQFATAEFDAALTSVKTRIGASAKGVVHNPCNSLLLQNCKKLGCVRHAQSSPSSQPFIN